MYFEGKLRSIASSRGVEALLLTWEWNVFYFTRLPRPSGSYLLWVPGGPRRLYVPALDYWRAMNSVEGVEVVPYSTYRIPGAYFGVEVIYEDLAAEVVRELRGLGVSRVGIDTSYPTTVSGKVVGRAVKEGLTVVDVSEDVSSARAVKSSEEVELMRRALRITEESMERVRESLIPGLREFEVAGILEASMRFLRADGLAFETIVASGLNAAYPHATVTDRAVREGEVLLIDAGARYSGYCSDMTRTFTVGEPPAEVRRAIEAVAEAVGEAQDRVSDGVAVSEVDEAAREVLRRHGLDRYFIHSTGHGVGVEVHEKPRLSSSSKELLREGMVVTIEPGVYVNGRYGVRIENMVLVRKGGCEVLNKAPLTTP